MDGSRRLTEPVHCNKMTCKRIVRKTNAIMERSDCTGLVHATTCDALQEVGLAKLLGRQTGPLFPTRRDSKMRVTGWPVSWNALYCWIHVYPGIARKAYRNDNFNISTQHRFNIGGRTDLDAKSRCEPQTLIPETFPSYCKFLRQNLLAPRNFISYASVHTPHQQSPEPQPPCTCPSSVTPMRGAFSSTFAALHTRPPPCPSSTSGLLAAPRAGSGSGPQRV